MFSQHHKESAFSKQYIKLNLNFCFETDIHDHGYILTVLVYRDQISSSLCSIASRNSMNSIEEFHHNTNVGRLINK